MVKAQVLILMSFVRQSSLICISVTSTLDDDDDTLKYDIVS